MKKRWVLIVIAAGCLMANGLSADQITDKIKQISSEARQEAKTYTEEVPQSIDDFKAYEEKDFTPDELPKLAREMTRRLDRHVFFDIFIKWRLLQSFKGVDKQDLHKCISTLARAYKASPKFKSLGFGRKYTQKINLLAHKLDKEDDAKKSRRYQKQLDALTEQKKLKEDEVTLTNMILRRYNEDFTKILLASDSSLAAQAVARRLRDGVRKKDYTCLDIVDAVSAQAQKGLSPSVARIFRAALQSAARSSRGLKNFVVPSTIEFEDDRPSSFKTEKVDFNKAAQPAIELLTQLEETEEPEEPQKK